MKTSVVCIGIALTSLLGGAAIDKWLDLPATSTSPDPAPNTGRIYFKPDGKPYYKWGSTESALGRAGDPGGGIGQIQVNDGKFGGRNVGSGLLMDNVNLMVDTSLIADLYSSQSFGGSKTFSGTLTVTGSGAEFNASGANTTRPMKLVANDPKGACADGQMAVRATGAQFVCVSGTWAPASIIANGPADPPCNATNLGLEFLNTASNPSKKKICGKNSSGQFAWGTITVAGW